MGVFALWALLLLLSSSSIARFCIAVDRLLPGEFLLINQSLVSDGGNFKFGFFTLGASPPRQYVGIWYNNVYPRTIVWVANKEKPFAYYGPLVFRLSSDSSQLQVTNSGGTILWSSSTTTVHDGGVEGNGTMAVLLDSGNLVLRSAGGYVRWQSFDFPGDTGLPGMIMWFDAKTRRGNYFLTWKSADDPAPGDFTMGVDPKTMLQLMAWKRNQPHWRYNPWTGTRFGGLGLISNQYASYFSIQGSLDEGVNVTFSSSLPVLQRLYLDYNGIFWVLYWSISSQKWVALWSNTDTKACEAYGSCGAFGFCNKASGGTPACTCLPGYVPSSQSEWSRGNHSAGCAPPNNDWRCGEEEASFGALTGMKLPDNMVYLRSVVNERACEAACRSNCSCTAYAHANYSTANSTTSRCLVWYGDLIDLLQYRFSYPSETLNFRLPGGGHPAKEQKAAKVRFIVMSAIGVVVLSAILVLVWMFTKGSRGLWRRRKGKESAGGRDANEAASQGIPPLLSFECITAITGDFSYSNMLGEGGFGKVYKGVMPTGELVAVKRLSRDSSQGQEEFKNEVSLIAKLQHRNLVKLLGSCVHSDERILIYEYVPNGSLSTFIFDPAKQAQLNWETRFNIIKGIARGLMYLHQDSRFKIVHRDLKASNVLLDGDMNPKISDFGMARMFGGNDSRCLTQRVVGTYGYMSPEYAMEGHYSVKSDVYSFGVVLLEILSGRRNIVFYDDKVLLNLLIYAWHMWKEERPMGFLDPSIANTCSSPAEVSRCLHVGLLCVQDSGNKRPPMSAVAFMLEDGSGVPIQDEPNRPMFLAEAGRDMSQVPQCASLSANDVTITVVEGR